MKSTPSSTRRNLFAWAALALLVAGCAGRGERIIPVLRPVPTASVKQGEPGQALVVLPNKGAASVRLPFVYTSGRIAIHRLGVVNHYPERVQVFFAQSRVYVDEGEPLKVLNYTDFDNQNDPLDFRMLKALPEGAKGKWMGIKPRYVTRSSLRGPTVVLFYSVKGHDGFVKVGYQAIWNVSGR